MWILRKYRPGELHFQPLGFKGCTYSFIPRMVETDDRQSLPTQGLPFLKSGLGKPLLCCTTGHSTYKSGLLVWLLLLISQLLGPKFLFHKLEIKKTIKQTNKNIISCCVGMAYAFSLPKANRFLWVPGNPGPYSEWQASPGYLKWKKNPPMKLK